MKHHILVVIICMCVSACQTTPVSTAPFAPISYTQKGVIPLKVDSITVEQPYHSPLAVPNVEHYFPTLPADAIRRWVDERIEQVGYENRLVAIIHDASAIEQRRDDGQSEVTAKVHVELRIYGHGTVSEANINVTAQQHRLLPASLNVIEKDKAYDEITRALMDSLDAELEQNIRTYFEPYVAFDL